jgi:hypothetical protein
MWNLIDIETSINQSWLMFKYLDKIILTKSFIWLYIYNLCNLCLVMLGFFVLLTITIDVIDDCASSQICVVLFFCWCILILFILFRNWALIWSSAHNKIVCDFFREFLMINIKSKTMRILFFENWALKI